MRYKVSYSVIHFDLRESIRYEKIVDSTSKVEAVRVVLIETKGNAISFNVEEIDEP